MCEVEEMPFYVILFVIWAGVCSGSAITGVLNGWETSDVAFAGGAAVIGSLMAICWSIDAAVEKIRSGK